MKAFIKKLVTLAILILIAIGLLAAGFFFYLRETEPAAIRSLRLEHELKTMQQWFIIGTLIRYSFGLSVSIGFLAVARYIWVRTRMVERLRYENGLLPALEKDVTPWYLKLLGHAWIAPINLNHMGGATSLIRVSRSGTLEVQNDNLGMQEENQRRLVDGVHSVQRHAAGRRSGETVAEVKGRLGHYSKPTRPEVITPPAIVTNPARQLTLNEAIHHPDGAVLGQNPKTGELAIWSPPTDGHIGIWGGTRQGKSSRAAMTAVLWLIESDYHVLILDIDKGKTWGVLDGWAEFNPTDEDLFPGQCKNLMREWKRRTDLLAHHRAYDWSALPTDTRDRPIAVVVEEYHALRLALQASDPAKLDYADKAFSTLARRGAATGIYLMMIDQVPEDWPAGVKSNCLTTLTFAQGFGKGNAVGYYHAHELRSGEFYFRGQTYRSWLAAPEATNLLRSTPKRIKSNPYAPQASYAQPTAEQPVEDGTPEQAATAAAQPLETGDVINLEEWVGNNEEVSRQWVQANEEKGVNALARHLATHNGLPASEYRRYQSEASKWWNLYNPRGTNYVPPELNVLEQDELDLNDPAVREALRNHPESWQVKA